MPFNPCGRGVAYLREAVTDVIRPFTDSFIETVRRWYPVPEDTPLIGFPTVFTSNRWEPFPYLERTAGEVYAAPVTYPRVGTPPGLTYDHVCSPADLATGAKYDPTVHVVYDDEWIPECCGRESVCTTQLCAQDPVMGWPAAQLWSFPINHQDADGTTPAFLFQRAKNAAGTPFPSPGWLTAWYPAGRDNPPVWTWAQEADPTGALQSDIEEVRFAADNAITVTKDSAGWTLAAQLGVDSGEITAQITDGVLELCGTNATICRDLLPTDTSFLDSLPVQAFGTVYATASPLIAGVHYLLPLGLLNRAFRLIPSPGAVVTTLTGGVTNFLIYPDPLVSIGSGAPGAAFTPSAPFGIYTGVRYSFASGVGLFPDRWLVEYFSAEAGAGAGSFTTLTVSDLTAGRVVVAGVGGLLESPAALAYAGTGTHLTVAAQTNTDVAVDLKAAGAPSVPLVRLRTLGGTVVGALGVPGGQLEMDIPTGWLVFNGPNSGIFRLGDSAGVGTYQFHAVVRPSGQYSWAAGGGNATATPDTGTARHAAGVVRVTDGNTGMGSILAALLRANANSAPADGDLANGELAVWMDATNGAAALRVKAKQADGTVVTGSIPLT